MFNQRNLTVFHRDGGRALGASFPRAPALQVAGEDDEWIAPQDRVLMHVAADSELIAPVIPI